jgi:hypothetical protein
VINFLTKYNSGHPYIDKALRYISKNKGNSSYWISTKTTSLVLEAVANRVAGKSTGNNTVNYKVFLGASELLTGEFTSRNLLDVVSKTVPVKDIQQNGYTDVRFEKSGPGNFYYEVSYRYFLKDKKIKPVENGMSLIRQFIDDSGKPVDLTKLKEKDMFWVKLTLVVPSTRKNVLIEDFFPAGLESINVNLANSRVLAGVKPKELEGSGENGGWWYGQARTEYKDDVTAFFINYLSPGIYEYSYKVRATTPGNYIYAPASAYEMYTPDVFGNSAGSELVVSASND